VAGIVAERLKSIGLAVWHAGSWQLHSGSQHRYRPAVPDAHALVALIAEDDSEEYRSELIKFIGRKWTTESAFVLWVGAVGTSHSEIWRQVPPPNWRIWEIGDSSHLEDNEFVQFELVIRLTQVRAF
jgi:hypothetical protein